MPKKINRHVSEIDANGKSVWTTEALPLAVQKSPWGNYITDLWRIPRCPPDVSGNHAPAETILWPEIGGLIFRVAELAPYSNSQNWRQGLHASDTVDLLIVISGEVWAYQNDMEPVRLTPGDTLIQRGTMHAWENRTGTICLLACVHVGATRNAGSLS